MLDALRPDSEDGRRAEWPGALVRGCAEEDEHREQHEAERPVPSPGPSRGEPGQGIEAHPEQDEPRDVVAEVGPEIRVAASLPFDLGPGAILLHGLQGRRPQAWQL